MDFKLSPTEEAFRDGLRAWLEAHCPRDWEKTRQALGSPEARAEFLIDWQRRLHAAGYVGLHWPRPRQCRFPRASSPRMRRR